MPKLNIMRDDEADYLNGYINICSVQSNNSNITTGTLHNVDWIVDNGELDEIVADKVLEYYSREMTDGIISNWVGKLRVGGKIIIGILEFYELVRMSHMRMLELDKINNIIFGKNKIKRQSICDTQEIIDRITQLHGLKLINHTLIGADSTLTFERIR